MKHLDSLKDVSIDGEQSGEVILHAPFEFDAPFLQ